MGSVAFNEAEIYLPVKVKVRGMPGGGVHVVLQDTITRLGREVILKELEDLRDVRERLKLKLGVEDVEHL